MKKAILVSLFFFLVLILPVKAPDNGTDLNLTSFPADLAEKLSISTFAGGLIASALLMLAFVLPTALFSKTILPPLFVGLICLGAAVAMNWLHWWFLMIIVLVVALLFGNKFKDIITGGGEKGG